MGKKINKNLTAEDTSKTVAQKTFLKLIPPFGCSNLCWVNTVEPFDCRFPDGTSSIVPFFVPGYETAIVSGACNTMESRPVYTMDEHGNIFDGTYLLIGGHRSPDNETIQQVQETTSK